MEPPSEPPSATHRDIAHRTIAQRAAARLADSLDPELPAQVDRALVEEAVASRSFAYDPGATMILAGFLLSVAQFGWQIYRDLRADRQERRQKEEEAAWRRREELETPVRELLLRRLRLEKPPPEGITPDQHRAILEAVSTEILTREEG